MLMQRYKLRNSQLGAAVIVLALNSYATAAPVSIDASNIAGEDSSSRFGIGISRSNTSRVYEGIDDQAANLPFILARFEDFYIEGLNIGYTLSHEDPVSWDLVAIPRFLGYEENDSTVLDGLGDAHYSYHGGISASWDSPLGLVNIQGLTDLLGQSGGSEVIGSLSHAYHMGNFTLTPAISFNWQDTELVDYYYGVSNANARPGRDSYKGDSTINTAVSLTVGYSLSDNLQLIGQLRADQYGSEIEDSPLVDTDNTSSTSVGLLYKF